MDKGHGDQDQAVLREAMEEVQYITSLLQNLSACAKLESGETELSMGAVDLNGLVERVVARHSPIAKQKQVELGCGVPAEPTIVQGDVTLLEQAISNLVHNAVRYVDPEGHVAMTLDTLTQGRWTLKVIDDGPGIDEAQVQNLMKRSFRGDGARTRYPEGQGLGLHIALEVVRRHDYRLDFGRSEYGGLVATLSGRLTP